MGRALLLAAAIALAAAFVIRNSSLNQFFEEPAVLYEDLSPYQELDVDVDTFALGGVIASSGNLRVYRVALGAASYAPGDSIRIGITPYLQVDTTGGLRWNSKIERATGARAVNYTGTWTLLGAHSNLLPSQARDSFYVPRPAPGVTWTYRGCVQTTKPGAEPSTWRCKVFVYTRPQVQPPPPDSVVVDSNRIRVARIFVTPPTANVSPGTAECKALANPWRDSTQTRAKAACESQVKLANGTVETRPQVVMFCAYAQTKDGKWHLTTNSAAQRRCIDEFPKIVDGTVVGASWEPGAKVEIPTFVNGLRLAAR